MSKYRFSTNQRFAVFKAFNGVCQWCREPVPFQNFHVDHVLPEELLGDTARLQAILHTYGLPSGFDINDYENWIPAHPYCNQGKSDKVYAGAPFIRTILDACERNKEIEQRMELKLDKEPEKADILTRVQAAISLHLVSLEELQNFVLKSDIMDSDDEDLHKIRRDLEQKIEYQTEKMVVGIIDMLRMHTFDVARSMCAALGSDWSTYVSVLHAANDSKYSIAYPLKNKITNFIAMVIVSPNIANNQLIINFKNKNGIISGLTQDLDKGVDYEAFRKALREAYKLELTAT